MEDFAEVGILMFGRAQWLFQRLSALASMLQVFLVKPEKRFTKQVNLESLPSMLVRFLTDVNHFLLLVQGNRI
jgi:hypothetical protein